MKSICKNDRWGGGELKGWETHRLFNPRPLRDNVSDCLQKLINDGSNPISARAGDGSNRRSAMLRDIHVIRIRTNRVDKMLKCTSAQHAPRECTGGVSTRERCEQISNCDCARRVVKVPVQPVETIIISSTPTGHHSGHLVFLHVSLLCVWK